MLGMLGMIIKLMCACVPTAFALAQICTGYSSLEALTVFFLAVWLLAVAPFEMLGLPTLFWSLRCDHQCIYTLSFATEVVWVVTWYSIVLLFKFGPKCSGVSYQNLLLGLQSDFFIAYLIVAADTCTRWGAEPVVGKAFAVQFQAFRAPAVARLVVGLVLCWRYHLREWLSMKLRRRSLNILHLTAAVG
jgi:hypothetical protein